jgi:rfaE bifunctional protein nucleotidyltransferase chain/domain
MEIGSQKLDRKIIDRERAAKIGSAMREAGEALVFTNGCFDLIHPGHVDLLLKARMAGDRLMVGLNSDASVKRLKGPNRPILDQRSRSLMLAALEVVDWVVLFDEDTPLDLIAAVKPMVLVKGADYKADDVVGKDIVEANGGRVELIPISVVISTSTILEKLSMD